MAIRTGWRMFKSISRHGAQHRLLSRVLAPVFVVGALVISALVISALAAAASFTPWAASTTPSTSTTPSISTTPSTSAQAPRLAVTGGQSLSGQSLSGQSIDDTDGLEKRVPYARTGEFDYRREIPDWEFDKRFPSDSFRFVRLHYPSYGVRYGSRSRGYRGGRGGRGGWLTDFPDSDLNFSFRLQQLTSLKVDPEPISLRPIDPELLDYPFVYMIEPGQGQLFFEKEDADAMRRYLLNGGFMMVDDFWDDFEYEWFYREIKKVFPNREPERLTLDHPIFHNVYDLKELPQVPSIHSWRRYGGSSDRYSQAPANFFAIYDDEHRMCVIICHNTDLGDGWEREGENREYFELYSEKKSYPMGINIITWAMTH